MRAQDTNPATPFRDSEVAGQALEAFNIQGAGLVEGRYVRDE